MPADNLRLSSPLLIAELVLFASSLCVWGIIVQRLRRGVPVVAHEPRRAVPWKGVDLAFILLAWLLVAVLGQQASVRLQGDQPPADVSAPADATRPAPAANALKENHDAADRVLGPRDLVLSLIVELLSIGIAAGWVIFRVRATPLDMGFDLSRIGSDLLLGGATFLATFLPVSLLQEFLTTEVQPYNHPLIKAVGNRPDGLMLALAGAVAVLVAPLAEEFFFRVLVQGCFEAVEAKRRLIEWAARSAASQSAVPGQPKVDSADRSRDKISNPSTIGSVLSAASDAELTAASGPTLWPIIATSTIFALMHWTYGMSSFPLFFFALGLGYVYQRTHRIWPSLVAHLLLNATSMATLWYLVTNPSK